MYCDIFFLLRIFGDCDILCIQRDMVGKVAHGVEESTTNRSEKEVKGLIHKGVAISFD